jgi:hypothetical protein
MHRITIDRAPNTTERISNILHPMQISPRFRFRNSFMEYGIIFTGNHLSYNARKSYKNKDVKRGPLRNLIQDTIMAIGDFFSIVS